MTYYTSYQNSTDNKKLVYLQSIENIMYSFCIRFERLHNLIQNNYQSSNANIVNLYIDMNSLCNKFIYNIDNILIDDTENEFKISSCIINVCAHYREFFRRIGVATNIFLIYGLNSPDYNTSILPEYNLHNDVKYHCNIEKGSMNIFNRSIDLLKILCSSIPDIYYINIGNHEVTSYIYYIIDKFEYNKNPNIENIILSKDPMTFQSANINCSILRPIKTLDNVNNTVLDNSILINKSSLYYNYMVFEKKCKYNDMNINTNLFTNVLSMSGLASRDIKSEFRINTTINIINSIKNTIPNNILHIDQSVINNMLVDKIKDPERMYNIWKCIDSSNHLINIISDYNINNPIFSNIIDKEGLHEIINNYYQKYPIDIMWL